MIIKTDQLKSEYVSSVYVRDNSFVSTGGYMYWKFPLPKVVIKDATGLGANEKIMLTPYKVEVVDGNTDFDITIETDYVIVKPKPAVQQDCYVGNPSMEASNHPLKFIKYYYTLNGSNVEKTCAELVTDNDYVWLNYIGDGFEID